MSVLLEVLKYIETISISAAAITAAIIGIRGLKAWKKELSGKVKFEAAKSLLTSTYKLRDGLNYYRSPFIPAHEFPKDYDPLNRSSISKGEALASVYRNRWKEDLEVQYREFDVSLLEAEVIWGEEIRLEGQKMKKCIVQLRTATDAIIENEFNGGGDFSQNKDFGVSMRKRINTSGKDDNPLTIEIDSTIMGIETLMRKQLEH